MKTLSPSEGYVPIASPDIDRVREFGQAEALRNTLKATLQSPEFARAGRSLRAFLEFVVESALMRRADRIKQTTIAIAAYGDSADFEPAISSKIRVAATELRRRLNAYALSTGYYRRFAIALPVGTYVPVFYDRAVTLVPGGLTNWTPHHGSDAMNKALADEIVRLCGQFEFIRQPFRQPYNACSERVFRWRGSFQADARMAHLIVSLFDVGGSSLVWVRRFEHERRSVSTLAERVSRAIVEALLKIRCHPVGYLSQMSRQ